MIEKYFFYFQNRKNSEFMKVKTSGTYSNHGNLTMVYKTKVSELRVFDLCNR